MRKVTLRMNEDYKFKIIKKLVDTNGNKKNAALKIDCSLRTVDRLIMKYKENGKAGFIHQNRNRKPAISFSDTLKNQVITLYENKYYNANIKHFSALLAEHEDIHVSDSSINNWLREVGILSPKARRKTKNAYAKVLRDRKKLATKKSEKYDIQVKLDSLHRYDAHPRRSLCAYFGELIQMDASPHAWFDGVISHLHLAIDDATGMILGAYFDSQETLHAYYQITHQILSTYGIPAKFLTDKRTVFEYKRKNAPSDAEDTYTQFSYACHQLGIQLESSSIPQAKGRVERLNQTLQSRLVIELRLAGITTIEGANKFLTLYLQKFNDEFSLPINSTKTVFEKQPDFKTINQTLAIISTRKLDAGHCIRYKNQYYLPITKNGTKAYWKKGMSALVIEAFDKTLYVNILDHLYALEVVPEREELSKTFDVVNEVSPKKHYIPPMSHPWKQASFNAYLAKQKHRPEYGANV